MKTKTILLTLTTLFAAAESGDAQTAPNDKKVLVAYFSHSGNTRAVAERIAAATGADLFEIVPQKPYPAEYRAVVDQARREIAADYRPALKTDLPDAGRYDVIYIGSPCWWSTVAPPVATFLAAHDFTGKTLIPFMTHEGSPHGPQRSRHPTALPRRDRAQRRPRPRQRRSAGRPRNPTARRGGRTLSADGTPDGRNRTGECESQSAAQGGRRWRAHRNPTKAIFADKHKNT